MIRQAVMTKFKSYKFGKSLAKGELVYVKTENDHYSCARHPEDTLWFGLTEKDFVFLSAFEAKAFGIEVVDGEPVWSMGKYFPTPEPLTRTISPSSSAKGKEFTNEWEIESAKKRVANGEVGVEIPVGIPCANNSPEACAKLIAEFGFDEWYGWNVANWGTKWDCNTRDTGIETNEDTVLQVSFDSAWSPPIKWLDKVQKDFPTLNFKLTFSEEGCGFCGMVYTGEVEEEGEIRQLEEEKGEYLYSDEDGNPCHYDYEKEGWVNSETGELYLNDDGEKDDDFYPQNKNYDSPETRRYILKMLDRTFRIGSILKIIDK